MNKKQMFNEVLDMVISRAQSWNAKILSQASRITLVKSVLASIPTYTSSTFYLSKNICSKIDVLRNLTWGHFEDKNSFFPMSWTKVCKPEDCAYVYIYIYIYMHTNRIPFTGSLKSTSPLLLSIKS